MDDTERLSDEQLAKMRTEFERMPHLFERGTHAYTVYEAGMALLAEVKQSRQRELVIEARFQQYADESSAYHQRLMGHYVEALTIAREVADAGEDSDMSAGTSWLLFPGLFAAETCRTRARKLLASTEHTDADGV